MISENALIPIPEPDEHWYILKVQIGSEFIVEEELQKQIASRQLLGLFDLFLPTEQRSEKISSRKLLYPGYIMVQCYPTKPLVDALLNHPYVKEFALLEYSGEGSKPIPEMMDPADVRRMREID